MHKTLRLLFCFLFLSLNAQQQLSESAEVSVITVGPGTLLNDSFGHSGFRIKDKAKNIDLIFNYGVYDFEAPNFILKFAQGRLNYLIGVNRFDDFFQAYRRQNRTIKEQLLNLKLTDKQKLFDYLIKNYKPENRRYLYDFFYDNCATKIKEVTNAISSETITYNAPNDFKPSTFRTLIQNNLNRNSWGSFGIDLALGSVIDVVATPEEHMFLPENIYNFFKNATVGNTEKLLVKENKTLYEQKPVKSNSNFFLSPLFILGLLGLVILYITYKDYKNNRQTKSLDVLLFGITGLIGVMILLLWFATDHKGTHQNYNLLWACALNIIVVFQFFKKRISTWFIKYVKLLIILLCLLTLHWLIGVQVYAITLIPLLIALFIRYVYLVKYYSTENK